jgi:CRP/FNR family transcriptional regulator
MLEQMTYSEVASETPDLTPAMQPTIGRVLPKKTPLFHQGDDATHFYKVQSGVIMTYRLLEDSQRQITGFCTAGDYFGMSPDDVYHDTAITVSTSNIISLTMAEVRADVGLQRELFVRTCCQLEDAQNMMMTLSKKTAGEKVASFLVMLAKRQTRLNTEKPQEVDINLPMSRLDIADYLGLTIETVSRRLTHLKSKGVIKLPSRHTAHVCQLGQLEHMAGALT